MKMIRSGARNMPLRHLTSHFATNSVCPKSIYSRLSHLEEIYPDFSGWFWHKFEAGAVEGSRAAFTYMNDSAFGVVIAKRGHDERKICTVYVSPEIEHSGVATHLLETAMRWLDCSKPLLTVPEEKIIQFKGILNRWNFTLTQIAGSYYRQGRDEYVFNGELRLQDILSADSSAESLSIPASNCVKRNCQPQSLPSSTR